MTEETEQILKNVNPQEANSLVQTPLSDDPAARNGLRGRLQKFESVETSIKIYKLAKMRHAGKKSLL